MEFSVLFVVIFALVQFPSTFRAFSFLSSKAAKLEKYNVEENSITVSGISSGGAMSSQFHFIYSSEVKGAGIFAAGPYLCGNGGTANAAMCMTTPKLQSVPSFIAQTDAFSSAGKIDPVANIKDSKVYIFHGSQDIVVNQESGKNLKTMYDNYQANVKAQFEIAAGHGQPVDGNVYGGPCGSTNVGAHYVNECGYNGAYEMFNWLYGNDTQNLIRPPSGFVADGDLLSFDQSEFFTVDPLVSSMSRNGLIYVPKACKNNTGIFCKFHLAFHGCMSNEQLIGKDYATKTQYLEVAEKNNIIVLFPQTSVSAVSPSACWDWFGYTGFTAFATKSGSQPAGLHKMMKRVTG